MAEPQVKLLLSIIIPAYNARPFLARGLQNLCVAADARTEIIVVDDGSTDGSGAQAEAVLSHNGCKYRVLTQKNQGVSVARNHGLQEARGKYILFLDADDRLHPQFLADFKTEAAESAADALAWRCQVRSVEPEGFTVEPGNSEWTTISGTALIQEIILQGKGWYPTGSVAFRREFLEDHGLLYEPGCACGEDQEFTLKALSLAKTVQRTDTVYTTIVQRQGSVMRSDSLRRFEVISALQRLAGYFAQRPEPWAQKVAVEIGGPRLVSNFFLNLKASYRQAGAPEPRAWLAALYAKYPGLPAVLAPLLADCPGLERRLRWEARLFRLAPHLYLKRVGRQVRNEK